VSGIDAAEVITDLLRRGHAVQFRVLGDSMHPVIREEDLVHVEPLSSFAVGDVVLTQADRRLTAHRVVSLQGDVVVTRGDNSPEDDAPADRARVLGVVTWVERAGARRGVAREHVVLRVARRLRRMLR
jgi:signal peptidase I